jgi:hypothetical protein
MGDATYGCRNRQTEFVLGHGRPPGRFNSSTRCGGAPIPSNVLLERYPHERRDDARSGDERATQCA